MHRIYLACLALPMLLLPAAATVHADSARPHSKVRCDAAELIAEQGCLLTYGELRWQVISSNGGSLNTLRVIPAGLSVSNEGLIAEIDGTAYTAEVADLDANGWPEIYVYASSAGSGSYGSVYAWAVNNGKSMTPVYLPPLGQAESASYQGHDEFAVVENRLVRRFPLYRADDVNSAPGGGQRQVQYRLEAGEAGWVLVPDRVVDY